MGVSTAGICVTTPCNSGGIALDPSHFKTDNTTAKQEADLLHKACVGVGAWVGTLQPDLIVLSTPHGIADLNNFAFYLNSMVLNRPYVTRFGKRDLFDKNIILRNK